MSKIELIAFTLLIAGTLGLLINEFFLDWGRSATLLFALFNIVGLALLGFAYWRGGQKAITRPP